LKVRVLRGSPDQKALDEKRLGLLFLLLLGSNLLSWFTRSFFGRCGTIWRILRQHQRIRDPIPRVHHPTSLPPPLSSWQIDFKDAGTVPADPNGKQVHVVKRSIPWMSVRQELIVAIAMYFVSQPGRRFQWIFQFWDAYDKMALRHGEEIVWAALSNAATTMPLCSISHITRRLAWLAAATFSA
jgi:hypothetical protein